MLWFSTEVWVDILKFLPRSDLLKSVQPSNRRLNAICECHIDNLHIIRKFSDFLRELADDLPEANNRLENLTSDGCNLGRHFRIDHRKEVEFDVGKKLDETDEHFKHRLRKQQLALSSSLELFCFCHLYIYLTEDPADAVFFDQYMAIIRPLRPQLVHIGGDVPEAIFLRWGQLLGKPMVMDCPRVSLTQTAEGEPGHEDGSFQGIFHSNYRYKTNFITSFIFSSLELFRWLHHHNIKKGDNQADQQTRLLNVLSGVMLDLEGNAWEQLIGLCLQNFFDSSSPSDRRPFVLTFASSCSDLHPFKFTNLNSGEVLLFDPTDIPFASLFFNTYRLRRCLIAEATEAAMEHFYGQMFDDNGEFRVTEEDQAFEAGGAGATLVLC